MEGLQFDTGCDLGLKTNKQTKLYSVQAECRYYFSDIVLGKCFSGLQHSPRGVLFDRSYLPISRKRPCLAKQRKLACSFSSAKEFRTTSTPVSKHRLVHGISHITIFYINEIFLPLIYHLFMRFWPLPCVCFRTCCSKEASLELANDSARSCGNRSCR